MSATSTLGLAEDVNITFEDQQEIILHGLTRRTELKEEIEVIKQQFQNLEDACDDITLPDDYLMTPYPIGDAFTSHFQEETPQMVEEKFARGK